MEKTSLNEGVRWILLLMGILSVIAAVTFGDNEPNLPAGMHYSTSIPLETAGISCGWETVVDREGWDGGHLTVRIDSCRVFECTVETVEQSTPLPIIIELTKDDIFIEWDEDPGDGSRMDFTFTNNAYVAETPDYMEVSRPAGDSVTNWVVYRVLQDGTLTITNTGFNEHEIFHLNHNIMDFQKYDGMENDPNACVSPEDTIIYTICFDNLDGQLLEDAFILDWLPSGVSYPAGQTQVVWGDPNDPNEPLFTLLPPDPGYDAETHTYCWVLDRIDPNESNCVQLTVVVNENALPGQYLHNVAELWGSVDGAETQVVARAIKDTLVCCYEDTPDVLYVDQTAVSGGNTGRNWANAFLDLQDALDYARNMICGQVQSIYVAQGTYSPGGNTTTSFVLPDTIAVYGGFKTGGSDFSQRNPKKYKTTLTGYIDETTRNTTVVVMGDETLLDGVTITSAAVGGRCVYGSGVDFTIVNSTIEKSWGRGIRATDGNVTLQWCQILNNDLDGVFHQGAGFVLNCENCWIRKNMGRGIYCLDSTPVVRNSVVTESDLGQFGNAGIFMLNPASQPVFHNLTVAHNKSFGIAQAGGPLPDMKNSIVYHNGGPALAGFSADEAASYCCIEDCNDVNNNISVDPEFIYFDPNNVRITVGGPCHDSGLTLQESYAQVDMDNRIRVLGAAVDRGAYEIECEDTANSFDRNYNGLVNLHEFADFSRVWLAHDPNDPAVSDPNHSNYEYYTDPNNADYVTPSSLAAWYPDGVKFNYSTTGASEYTIDLADLMYWVDEAPWLWRACWLTETELLEMTSGGGEMLLMGGGFVIPAEAGIQSYSITETDTAEVQQKSVQEQMFDLATAIVFLEQIWLEDPQVQQEIDTQTWQDFMDALYQNLTDLKIDSVQIK